MFCFILLLFLESYISGIDIIVKWEFDSIGIMQTMPMIESDMTDYFTTEKRTTNEKKAYGKIIFSID
jgi:hypothetical protein